MSVEDFDTTDVLVMDDLANADWLRSSTWDIWTSDGRLAESADDLAQYLHDTRQGEGSDAILAFLTRPAAAAMPARMRSELAALGYQVPAPAAFTPREDTPQEVEADGDYS